MEQSAQSSLASVSGPTAEEAPCLDLSELWHGRLYMPIVHVSVGGRGRQNTTLKLDQKVWNQLRSFHYLERLEVSGCSVAPDMDADFFEITHLRSLAIVETQFLPKDIQTLVQLPQLENVIFERKQGIDEWLPYVHSFGTCDCLKSEVTPPIRALVRSLVQEFWNLSFWKATGSHQTSFHLWHG